MQADLRRKLIREVLDTDKNINKRVSQIQIKNVPKEDARLLKKQLNSDKIQKLNVYASSIRKILEYKKYISKMLLSNVINQEKMDEIIIDLSSIEQLNAMYNYIIGIYRNLGLSQQSRQVMKSIIMTMENYTDSIVKHMKLALPRVSNNININSFKNALNFYEILLNKIKNGNIFEISRDEMIHKSMNSPHGVDYRQPTAPFFTQNHGYTFDTPSANVVNQPQPVLIPQVIQETQSIPQVI